MRHGFSSSDELIHAAPLDRGGARGEPPAALDRMAWVAGGQVRGPIYLVHFHDYFSIDRGQGPARCSSAVGPVNPGND